MSKFQTDSSVESGGPLGSEAEFLCRCLVFLESSSGQLPGLPPKEIADEPRISNRGLVLELAKINQMLKFSKQRIPKCFEGDCRGPRCHRNF